MKYRLKLYVSDSSSKGQGFASFNMQHPFIVLGCFQQQKTDGQYFPILLDYDTFEVAGNTQVELQDFIRKNTATQLDSIRALLSSGIPVDRDSFNSPQQIDLVIPDNQVFYGVIWVIELVGQ